MTPRSIPLFALALIALMSTAGIRSTSCKPRFGPTLARFARETSPCVASQRGEVRERSTRLSRLESARCVASQDLLAR